MGLQGCILCSISTPLSCYSIPGGLACFFFVSWYQRGIIIRQWDVQEEEPCCFGPCNPICSLFHFHCNYPCSFFQMYMSIKEWDEDLATAPLATVVIGSSNNNNVPTYANVQVQSPGDNKNEQMQR